MKDDLLLYPLQWILWITHEYGTAATVRRDFRINPLEGKILQVEFSNMLDILISTKYCLGIFLAAF